MVRSPFVGAVQLHQTEPPPGLPAWSGSPGSLVASSFDPMTVTLVPVRVIRSAKLSLAGRAAPAPVHIGAHSAIRIRVRARSCTWAALFIVRPGLAERSYL